VGDGYKFLFPFGWQEVAVTGADVVFKDIVEPLESVSVTITSTDKKDIVEFGGIQEVSDSGTLEGNFRGFPTNALSMQKRFNLLPLSSMIALRLHLHQIF
jgi:hypothetical protein